MGIILPGSILTSAERAQERRSFWTAKAGNKLNYVEEISPNDVFGASCLCEWLRHIAHESGYPIHIQHSMSGPPTKVLATAVLNGPRFIWGCVHCSESYRSAAVAPTPRDPACPQCRTKDDTRPPSVYSYQEEGKLLFNTPAELAAIPLPAGITPKSYPAILVFHEIDPDPNPTYLLTQWVYPEDFDQ